MDRKSLRKDRIRFIERNTANIEDVSERFTANRNFDHFFQVSYLGTPLQSVSRLKGNRADATWFANVGVNGRGGLGRRHRGNAGGQGQHSRRESAYNQ